MEIGATYTHISIQGMTCVPQEYTNKGAKVLQTETFPGSRKKPKTKTAYYSDMDFSRDKGIWKK